MTQNSISNTQTECHIVPYSRAYWVIPGKLLAGCYPGSEGQAEAVRKLKSLLNHGIRHVIDLMELGEANWNGDAFRPYAPQMGLLAKAAGIEVTFDRMAIKDTWVPSRLDMCRILDRIDQCIQDHRPVYIHCWGGRGRTGTVVGCYLARHGFATGDDILKLIQNLRKDTKDHDKSSPETSQQIDMILSWVEVE